MKQSTFANFHQPYLSFGGDLIGRTTNPKTARPLSSKLPIHLVLRSKRSWMRTPRQFGAVNATVARVAKRHGVRVYEFANVGNHLHVLIRIAARPRWAPFIRELTGRLAMLRAGGAEWVGRPFTRVVNGWRRAYRSVREYVRLNSWEAEHGLDGNGRRALRELRRVWRTKPPAD